MISRDLNSRGRWLVRDLSDLPRSLENRSIWYPSGPFNNRLPRTYCERRDRLRTWASHTTGVSCVRSVFLLPERAASLPSAPLSLPTRVFPAHLWFLRDRTNCRILRYERLSANHLLPVEEKRKTKTPCLFSLTRLVLIFNATNCVIKACRARTRREREREREQRKVGRCVFAPSAFAHCAYLSSERAARKNTKARARARAYRRDARRRGREEDDPWIGDDPSLRHRSPRNRGNMAAAQAVAARTKKECNFSVYLLCGIRSRSPLGKLNAREKTDDTRIHHRLTTFLKLDFSHRTVSHAIDGDGDDDCHSSSATTPKLWRGDVTHRERAPRRNVAAAPGRRAGGDGRCYEGRIDGRENGAITAAARRHTPRDTRPTTASRGRVAPLFSLARARRPRRRAAAVAGSIIYRDPALLCPRVPSRPRIVSRGPGAASRQFLQNSRSIEQLSNLINCTSSYRFLCVTLKARRRLGNLQYRVKFSNLG